MDTPTINVLLVEDNPGDARLLQEVLWEVKALQFQVSHVQRLSEALERLPLGGIDVVLLDLFLPDEYGLKTVARTRAAAPQVPIVVLTVRDDAEFALEALHEGAEDYLVKGQIDPHLLARALRYAIERHRLLSERRRAEEALLDSRDYALNIINSSLDMIIAVDSGRRIIEFNPAAQKAFGYPLDEVLGQHVSLLYADPTEGAQVHEQTVIQGYCVREVLNKRKNGEVFSSLLSACALRNARGNPLGVMGISRDCTEQKRAAEALRVSEERFRSVAQSAIDAIILTDSGGNILFWNKGAQSMFGYPEEEMLGRPLTMMIPERYRDAHQRGLERFRLSGESRLAGEIVELRGLRKDGREFPLELSLSTWRSGNAAFFSAIVRDLTQRTELQEKLRQAQKLESIGLLAGGIAHDFNNILTVILGHASQLRTTAKLTPKLMQSTERIMQAVERASHLTKQLLTFSRRQVIQPKDADLNEVVRSLTQMLQRIIGEDILLEVKLCSNLPLIRADQGMLEQIIMNLAVNSRDAMSRGGRLRIQTAVRQLGPDEVQFNPETSEGEFVCLRVSDTGSGIAPEHLPHIFEPFFTTKEVGKGTGLGLATVHGIVKQHRGWIQLESQVNAGTSFEIFFPAAGPPASAATKAPESAVTGGAETILLVEDEASVRGLARSTLEHYGYDVLEACSGIEAQGVWSEHKDRIQLLLTDMIMPGGMTGLELAGKLRLEKSELKVLYTSGYGAREVWWDFLLTQKVDFVEKPYAPQMLAGAVRECLDRLS